MSDTALKVFFAIVIVMALILFGAWLIRGFQSGRISTSGGRGRVPRLALIDATKLDNRRLLVLVRRDNVEHLLMIGGPTDVVVETNIARGTAQGRDAPRQPTPDQSWIEPEVPEIMPEPPPRPTRAPLGADERRAPPSMPVPPAPERRAEPMTGFVPESMTRSQQPAPRVEPPPVRRAEKPVAPPVAPPPRAPQPAAPRVEPPPMVAPTAPVVTATAATVTATEAMSQADKNLAEMAQRLEAALRAPGAAPRAEPPPIVPSKVDRVGAPPVAPDVAPARPAPSAEAAVEPPAAPPAEDAKPATGFESLEAEMASLLGRPKNPS